MQMTIDLLVGDDNQIYPALVVPSLAVVRVGDFEISVKHDDSAIIYSDDLGKTETRVVLSQSPNAVDMVDLALIVVVCDNGFVYGSYDAARTWQVLEAGCATSQDLTNVKIVRDDPQIIYAVSRGADAVIKTEDGGRTWSWVDNPLNQIYPTLVSEGEPIRTLIDSRTGTMRFASLECGIDEKVVAVKEEMDDANLSNPRE